MHDCVIIGGGPAGLTAAIYLARFHLDLVVIDAGRSRAFWIPTTHNHAGFPDGISGKELLQRMRDQATKYGTKIVQGHVGNITKNEDSFSFEYGHGAVEARTVILATGVVNRRPAMPEALHNRALAEGRIRYCPVCDGYEVTDKNVAVIGTADRGVTEAAFLRGYSKIVTLIAPDGAHNLDPAARAKAHLYGIVCLDGPVTIAEIVGDNIVVNIGADRHSFDSIYPALGSDVNNLLAQMAGLKCDESGSVIVDSHQRTSIEGIYAAGDVVLGLDQISHAMGEGGLAAVTVRNDLAAKRPLLR